MKEAPLGALFAFVHDDKPQLIDFDPVHFHPELKGLPDPLRGDQDRIWRCVSWGAGSKRADAFLAHAYRLLFGGQVPTVARANLAVAWTVDHVRRYNVGLVGGKLQLAVIEKRSGTWLRTMRIREKPKAKWSFLKNIFLSFAKNRSLRSQRGQVRSRRATSFTLLGVFTDGPSPLRAIRSTSPARCCTGHWTGLGHCVVFAPCDPRRIHGAKARHRAGGKASTSAIRGDLSGLCPSRAAMDLVSPCRWRCSKRLCLHRGDRAQDRQPVSPWTGSGAKED